MPLLAPVGRLILPKPQKCSKTPFNGQGQRTIYQGAVRSGQITITDPDKTLRLNLTSPNFGNIAAVNDGQALPGDPNLYLDALQNVITQPGGPSVPWYEVYSITDTSGSLAPDVYISQFGFGRNLVSPGTPPTLIPSRFGRIRCLMRFLLPSPKAARPFLGIQPRCLAPSSTLSTVSLRSPLCLSPLLGLCSSLALAWLVVPRAANAPLLRHNRRVAAFFMALLPHRR